MSYKAWSGIWQRSFTFLWGAPVFLTIAVTDVSAGCPPGATFSFSNNIRENIRTAYQDKALPASGVFVAKMSLDLAIAEVTFNAQDGSVATTIRRDIGRYIWRMTVGRADPISSADLIVTYKLTGPGVGDGYLVSVNDPSSMLKVTVEPQTIKTVIQGNKKRFSGFIDLLIDYSDATVSGLYNGVIEATVECG